MLRSTRMVERWPRSSTVHTHCALAGLPRSWPSWCGVTAGTGGMVVPRQAGTNKGGGSAAEVWRSVRKRRVAGSRPRSGDLVHAIIGMSWLFVSSAFAHPRPHYRPSSGPAAMADGFLEYPPKGIAILVTNASDPASLAVLASRARPTPVASDVGARLDVVTAGQSNSRASSSRLPCRAAGLRLGREGGSRGRRRRGAEEGGAG